MPLLGSLCALYECARLLSCVQLLVTLWTVTCQAPLSVGFSRQEYWRGLPFPTLGDPPDRWIKPVSWVSCIGRWILYHCTACEAPCALYIATIKCTHSNEALLNFLHWPLPAAAQCLKVETMYVLTITVNPVPSTWMNQQ